MANKKDKIEKDIQDRFFDILIDQKKGFEGTPLNVYQKLVYTRYEEVIKNSLPLFLDFVSADELKKSNNKIYERYSTNTLCVANSK